MRESINSHVCLVFILNYFPNLNTHVWNTICLFLGFELFMTVLKISAVCAKNIFVHVVESVVCVAARRRAFPVVLAFAEADLKGH